MKVTIHQPEHFPYMGFFQKINQADLFIVLDNVNFRKNYFQNRNKIKNRNGADEWITVPVEKKATSKKIREIQASTDPNWRRKVFRKIKDNLNFDASYFYEPPKLIDINMRTIKWGLNKLSIRKKILYASDITDKGEKSELLANLLKETGATEYISGPSGKDYLDMSFFNDIKVTFFEPKVENYYSSLYNILR